ncbi:MAG: glycosyltransferase family 2 protein [Rhodospirillales bacterium]|nr:glycosyltransferase family 2 protein [Rhodospirillales bacterium]
MTNRQGRIVFTVVVPCFNEQEAIEQTHAQLAAALAADPLLDWRILYVDDGSRDGTPAILRRLARGNPRIGLIRLSRNFGHQTAVTAGLEHAEGDAVGVIDADLQDPPEALLDLLKEWRAGYDVVYGVRAHRKEGVFKRAAYAAFYRLLQRLADIDIPLDSGDFCVMDRRVVDALNRLPERNRFVRGLRAWLGFSQKGVRYERRARVAGEPKYTLLKLTRLALDGIVNFSVKPLAHIMVLGFATSLLSLIGFIFHFSLRIFEFEFLGHTASETPGFTTIILAIFLFSGVQLVSIGIIGEYLGRIYEEIKGRPKYVIEETRPAAPDGPGDKKD